MADDDVAELQAKLEQAERERARMDLAHDLAANRALAAESALAAAQGALRRVLEKVQSLIAEFGDRPSAALDIVNAYADETLHHAALAGESGKPGGEALRPSDLAVEEFVRSDGFQSVRVTHKPTCRYGVGVAPSMVKAKALALEDLRTKMPPAEPRAAPPALPAELSGKGEQGLREALEEIVREGAKDDRRDRDALEALLANLLFVATAALAGSASSTAPVMGWSAWCDHLTAVHEKFRSEVKRLLADGIGPGGGYYAEDQRLTAAVGLLGVGWGACPAPEPGEAKKEEEGGHG